MVYDAALDHVQRKSEVAEVKDLEFGKYAGAADAGRDGLDVRGHVDQRTLPEVQAPHVKAADFRLECEDVFDPLLRRSQIRAWRRRVCLATARDETRARACGQVDDHRTAALANALYHLAIELESHAGLARLRIAYMKVCDRRARLAGAD